MDNGHTLIKVNSLELTLHLKGNVPGIGTILLGVIRVGSTFPIVVAQSPAECISLSMTVMITHRTIVPLLAIKSSQQTTMSLWSSPRVNAGT